MSWGRIKSLSVKREKSPLKIQTCLNIFEIGVQICTICIVLETLEHMAETGTNLLLRNIPSTQVSQDSHRIRSTEHELTWKDYKAQEETSHNKRTETIKWGTLPPSDVGIFIQRIVKCVKVFKEVEG